jgi:hypothetical protein
LIQAILAIANRFHCPSAGVQEKATQAMNSFDIVVLLALAIAVVTGFNTGLLRSAVTILAYLFAMPIAIWTVSAIAPQLGGTISPSPRTGDSFSACSWRPAWGSSAPMAGGRGTHEHAPRGAHGAR